MFFLYRNTDDGAFDEFSDHFRKISEDFTKLFRRPDEGSRTFSDNFRRLPKIFGEDPKVFRSYTNQFLKVQFKSQTWYRLSIDDISSLVRI